MNNPQAIFEQINNLIVILNPKGEAVFISPSCKKLLGYEVNDLLGENWWKSTSSKEEFERIRGNVLERFKNQNKSGSVEMERLLRTSYGDAKWFLWNSVLTEDGNILSVGTDISEKKKQSDLLRERNILLTDMNNELQDSLEYAQRLQEVILPDLDVYNSFYSDSFVLFHPRDKVSGDFHWYYENEDVVVVAAVDCTGHGVPGAMLSVVGNSFLRDIITKEKVYHPDKILSALDVKMIELMTKRNELKARDGMDISIVTRWKIENLIEFGGAFRSVLLWNGSELIEYSGSKYPIGFYQDSLKNFESVKLPIKEGDRLYMFSDGYTDQFGGPKGKKFKKSQLKEMLVSIQDLKLREQKEFVEYTFANWKQKEPQTDDVLMIGLEV